MKKISIFGSIIVLLVIGNVFLLYTNIDRQNKINALAAQMAPQTEEEQLAAGDILSQNARVTHPAVALPDSGLSLLVFFTIRSCASCLKYEVPNLNAFYHKYPDKTEVYLITGGNPFLEKYGAEFPAKLITPAESVLNVKLAIDNPVVVVTDSSGTVQGLYLSEVGNKSKSDRFYERMNTFFGALH